MPKKAETASVVVPEAEQPYQIPDNWRWVTIRGINCYCPHTVDPAKQPDARFELYSVPSMETDYPEIVHGSEIGSSKQSVQKNDVLLCKINPRINRVWKVSKYTDYELLASSEWVVIRNSRIDPDFMVYCLKSPYFREFMLSHVSGIGGSLMRAQPKHITSYPIPLPPLAEQQRIVDRIENLFTKLDKAREKAQAVVDGFELRKAAILYRAFNGELTAQWRKYNNISLNQWFKRKLGDCGTWSGGGTPSMKHPEYWQQGDLPWITPKDMKSDVIEDSAIHVNMSGVHHSSANYIETPSVLFVVRSGILRHTFPVAMVKRPFTVNQDLKALSPQNIDLNYLFWACKSCEKKILEICMKNGTTVESINTQALVAFQIPVAPEKEQKEIVRCVEFLLSREKAVKASAETVIDHIDAMKKAILGRAFRGELGTNDPSEESPDFALTAR